MLSCKELTELSTDYLKENLPWRHRLRVRVHLWMCRHCPKYVDQLRKVIGLLGRLPTEPVPPKWLRRCWRNSGKRTVNKRSFQSGRLLGSLSEPTGVTKISNQRRYRRDC